MIPAERLRRGKNAHRWIWRALGRGVRRSEFCLAQLSPGNAQGVGRFQHALQPLAFRLSRWLWVAERLRGKLGTRKPNP